MEMVAEAKIILVRQVCDMCGKGVMTYDFKSDQMCHVDYPHKCNKCGHEEKYPFRYPYPKFVPIELFREPVGKEI